MRKVLISASVMLAAIGCTTGSGGVADTRPSPSVAAATANPSPTSSPSTAPSPAASAQPALPHPSWPLPGYLLIADRGNDRMLLVDGKKHVLWRYPRPGVRPAMPFAFDDDTFFTPGYGAIVSNQEEQHTIQIIGFPQGDLRWRYGHVNQPGSAPGYLHTPDDAYVLPNGNVAVADISNCRILVIARDHSIHRTIGTTGSCGHDPPRLLGLPNGDTPLPDGRMLITEITGSWIDMLDPRGHLAWTVHAPIAYPSDAQWLGRGRILVADYAVPGAVLVMTKTGRVLWRYGPTSGPGELFYPSLAMRLPNGLIAVNDDHRDRVVVIDPKKGRIVWQYGHTDRPGTGPGLLDTPDGMDFLPFDVAERIPAIRRMLERRLGNGR